MTTRPEVPSPAAPARARARDGPGAGAGTSADSGADVDVLVVGAGPVGLSAAVLLSLSGVRVAVVERDTEPITQSRAVWVHPRTTELLGGMGVAEAARAEAVLMDRIDIYRGARYGGSIHYEGSGRTRFPEGMIIEQSRTQRLLLDRAAELGVVPQWGRRLVGLEQDGDGVTAQLTDAASDGSAVDAVRAGFVVGADGATSTVRGEIGLSLVGDTYESSFFTGDLVMRAPVHRQRASMSVTVDRTFALLPLAGRDRWRVVATVPREVERSLGRDAGPTGGPALALDQVEALMAGLRIEHEIERVDWATLYRSHHRVVDTFRVGRVALAGDAAHIHSPAGGLGMNTGIGDAADLAWRLALAVRGADAERLLGDYAAERRSVALDVLRTSDRIFTLQAGSGRALGVLRTLVFPTVPTVVNLTDRGRRLAFDALSQLGVSYAGVEGSGGRGLRVGDRLPLVVTADGTTSHDLLDPARFLLLQVGGPPGSPGLPGPPGGQALDALARALADRGDVPVATQCLPEEAARPLGVRPGDTLLVRPDGHVWWRGAAGDPAGLAERLDGVGLAPTRVSR